MNTVDSATIKLRTYSRCSQLLGGSLSYVMRCGLLLANGMQGNHRKLASNYRASERKTDSEPQSIFPRSSKHSQVLSTAGLSPQSLIAKGTGHLQLLSWMPASFQSHLSRFQAPFRSHPVLHLPLPAMASFQECGTLKNSTPSYK